MSKTEAKTGLTDRQRNCPHHNTRVTVMTPPVSGKEDERVTMSVCDGCKASFYRVGSEMENHIIDDGCVECDSKGNVPPMTDIPPVADAEPTPEKHPVNKSRGTISNIIVSHDENDPKFQRYPQYAPGYQPKGGDEEAQSVDKRGNRIRKRNS